MHSIYLAISMFYQYKSTLGYDASSLDVVCVISIFPSFSDTRQWLGLCSSQPEDAASPGARPQMAASGIIIDVNDIIVIPLPRLFAPCVLNGWIRVWMHWQFPTHNLPNWAFGTIIYLVHLVKYCQSWSAAARLVSQNCLFCNYSVRTLETVPWYLRYIICAAKVNEVPAIWNSKYHEKRYRDSVWQAHV